MSLVGQKMFRLSSSTLRTFSTKSAAPTMKKVSKDGQVKPLKAAPESAPPVGPGASKDGLYKNPEYYQYNPMSYFDIEKDMMAYRLPQPTSRK